MTIQYTLDDKKRRRLFQQILWTHIKAVFILFCIALVVGVVCIGIGFGLNYRNLWIDGFAFVGLAFLLAWICLGHYANDKQYILGERKGTKQYELTIDEDTVQLLEMDSGVLVRYNENDLRVKIKTADAIYLVFDRTQVLYFPRLSEIETVLPDPPTQSAKKRNKKQIATLLIALVVTFAIIGGAIGFLVGESMQMKRYLSDDTYQQLDCRIVQVYEESGKLCVTVDILSEGQDLQPIDGAYRFAFVSEGARSAGLETGDVVTIKTTPKRGKVLNAYLAAYLVKNDVIYVDFETGKHDVWLWQMQ